MTGDAAGRGIDLAIGQRPRGSRDAVAARSAVRPRPAARSRRRAAGPPTAARPRRGVPNVDRPAVAVEREDRGRPAARRPRPGDRSRTIVVERSARSAREPVDEGRGAGRIEVRGRFVEHEDTRARREHAGEGQALLLAARQASRSRRSRPWSPIAAGSPGHAPAWPAAARRGSPGRTRRRPRPAPSRAGHPGPARPSRLARRPRPGRGSGCRDRRARDDRPSTAGMSRGISPPIASASVLLPDPDGPTTSIVCPAGRSNDTPSSASRSEPRWPIERLRASSAPG